jgi:hypothetical protein
MQDWKRGNKVAERAKDGDEMEQPESYAVNHVKDDEHHSDSDGPSYNLAARFLFRFGHGDQTRRSHPQGGG